MANLQESSGIGFCIARGSAIAMVDRQVEREQRVTPLELFFDLVVVFAMTQVTQLISAELSWRGAGRGILVLAALWWAWTGYAWLTNSLEPEEGRVRAGCSPRWLPCSWSRSPSRTHSERKRCSSGLHICSSG
jgi:Bacterial low temperature requirement A protein (LtrA)